MKTKQYSQCRLQRGNAVRVSWLPAQYAVEGRVLKLRDNDVCQTAGSSKTHTKKAIETWLLILGERSGTIDKPRETLFQGVHERNGIEVLAVAHPAL